MACNFQQDLRFKNMKVKLCGFTEAKTVETAIAAKCNFLGFVFCQKSPRFITPKKAKEISQLVPSSIAKVAVVVDSDFQFLEEIAAEFSPDFFQFHGSETCDFLKKAREKFPQIKIIKAFKIEAPSDLAQVKNFESCADLFLFDGKVAGSGKAFNWKILQNFHCTKDWFLSGGLNIENITKALEITGASMIDISSGIEKNRGEKSSQLIAEFMNKILAIKK
jgi:phosphoribosylanthranilate isomerase